MADAKRYERKDINDETVQLIINVSKDTFKQSYENLLDREVKGADIKGFRKGTVPKEMIETTMKDQLLMEAFERLVPLYVSTTVAEEKIEAVAPPVYKDLPKLSTDKDLKITVEITVMPKFKLGKLKKIKVDKTKIEVTKEEVDKVITDLHKNQKTKEKKISDKWAVEVSKLLMIPDIKDLKDLEAEVKDIILEQKESVIRKELENDALSQGIELSKIKVPQVAADYEANEREHSFMHQLEHQNMTIQQYAENTGNTMEQMQEAWKKDAKEALETDVFLKLYAEDKKIEVSDDELVAEIAKIKTTQKVEDESVYEDPEWQKYIGRITLKQKAYTAFVTEILGEPVVRTPNAPKEVKKDKKKSKK